MPRTPTAFPWTQAANAACAAVHPLNLTARGMRALVAKAQAREQALDGQRRASATVQWADAVAHDAWLGSRGALQFGLLFAAPLGLVFSARARASAWACAVPVALFGTGATAWSQGTRLEQHRLGRVGVDLAGNGVLGALFAAAGGRPNRGAAAASAPGAGAQASAATTSDAGGPPRRRGVCLTVLDAILAGATLAVRALQLVVCLYPTLLVVAAVVAAGVLGCLVGAVVGAVRGLFAERRPPAPAMLGADATESQPARPRQASAASGTASATDAVAASWPTSAALPSPAASNAGGAAAATPGSRPGAGHLLPQGACPGFPFGDVRTEASSPPRASSEAGSDVASDEGDAVGAYGHRFHDALETLPTSEEPGVNDPSAATRRAS